MIYKTVGFLGLSGADAHRGAGLDPNRTPNTLAQTTSLSQKWLQQWGEPYIFMAAWLSKLKAKSRQVAARNNTEHWEDDQNKHDDKQNPYHLRNGRGQW